MNIFNITTVRFKMVMIVNVLLCVFYRKKKLTLLQKYSVPAPVRTATVGRSVPPTPPGPDLHSSGWVLCHPATPISTFLWC